jgi:hypothetical protein
MSSLFDVELTLHVLKILFVVPAVVSVPKLGSFFEAIEMLRQRIASFGRLTSCVCHNFLTMFAFNLISELP